MILFAMLRDRYHRVIKYLRLSVTDRCQARCLYCMPEHGVDWIPHRKILTFEETLSIVTLMAELGITTVKVTGGEPLLRRGVLPFLGALTKIPGIVNVALTTNAILLAENTAALIDAGIRSVNISLDSLDRARFKRIVRTDALAQTLTGLYAALDAGFNVKLNCVPVSGYNGADILPIAELARDHELAVRFIELMPLGAACTLSPVPSAVIKTMLEERFGHLLRRDETTGAGPAEYYHIEGFRGNIGFISPLTHNFCGQCNRLRLSASGLLRPCLASERGVDLKAPLERGESAAALRALIRDAVALKPAAHEFAAPGAADKDRYKRYIMHKIGG